MDLRKKLYNEIELISNKIKNEEINILNLNNEIERLEELNLITQFRMMLSIYDTGNYPNQTLKDVKTKLSLLSVPDYQDNNNKLIDLRMKKSLSEINLSMINRSYELSLIKLR
jgi:hypothetical protein